MNPELRVRDLLSVKHLRLSLIAGGRGVDRHVSWSHASELADPGVWLDGGELLITAGTGIAEGPRGQASYLSRLHHANVAGLALGTSHPTLAPGFEQAAEELSLPVLRVPRDVPFVSITRHIADATSSVTTRRLQTHVRVFDLLRPRAEGLLSAAELIDALAEVTGYELYVVAQSGRPQLREAHPVPAALLEAARNVLTEGPAIPDGYAIPIPTHGRAGATLLARDLGGGRGAGLSALRHAATVVGLELAMLQRERDEHLRRGQWLFRQLTQQCIPAPELATLLAACSLPTDGAWVVAAVNKNSARSLDADLAYWLQDQGLAFLMDTTADHVLLLVDERSDLSQMAAAYDLQVGISRPFEDLGAVALARTQSLWALRRLAADSGPRLGSFGDEEGVASWLPSDLGALRKLVDSVVGAVIAYDTAHRSELVRSLEVFLRTDRRLSVAADQLFVHKHTLAYRLKRVEALTGLDLTRVADQTQIWLALEARRALGEFAEQSDSVRAVA